jgi:radical SAM superfamily enzyme YgiQ (UPF0313 family)
MRILFVEVDTERSWAVASMGPACLAAYLRAHGHEVRFYRATLDASEAEVVDRILAEEPDLVGFSLTTRQWLRGRSLAAALRRRSSVPVVAGGLHPTFAPEATLAAEGFDYVCLGEGEAALLDLVEALQAGDAPQGIANIWQRGFSRPALRAPLPSLDELPFLARDLLDEVPGVHHLSTQRGCPFPCTYCAARMFDQLYEDTARYGRRRSHANVLAELEELQAGGSLSYVIFLDDTFTIHPGWVREFCQRYEQRFRLPFALHARVETVDQEMLQLLASAGCQQITYGVESGSERLRREVLKRPVSNDRFRQVFRWTVEAGVQVTANYMLGLPGENPADLQQTLDLAAELEVLDFGYFVFYPYPGTQLFQVCREQGYLPEDFLERPANHRQSILNLPELTAVQIEAAYEQFTELRRRRYEARLPAPARTASTSTALSHIDDVARHG